MEGFESLPHRQLIKKAHIRKNVGFLVYESDSFSDKNYQLVLGNFLSPCARNDLEFRTMMNAHQDLLIWQEIALHCEKNKTSEHQLIERLRASYQQRILMGMQFRPHVNRAAIIRSVCWVI